MAEVIDLISNEESRWFWEIHQDLAGMTDPPATVDVPVIEAPPMNAWEAVHEGVPMVRRMAVPGGWLYLTSFLRSPAVMVFVPSPIAPKS